MDPDELEAYLRSRPFDLRAYLRKKNLERTGISLAGVSPDMAQDVTRATPQQELRPSIDFDAMERMGISPPPVPPSLLASLQAAASRWDPTGQQLAETTPQVMAPPPPMVAVVPAWGAGPQQEEGLGAYLTRSALGGQPSMVPDEQSSLGRSLAEAAGREDIEALEKFRGKTPIGQDVSRLAAGVAMTPFAGAPLRAFGVDPEQQQRIDASTRGTVLRTAGLFPGVMAEIAATKGLGRAFAPGVRPGPARNVLNLVGETEGGNIGRRALRGAVEGIPTDIGFAVRDPDLSFAESMAFGSGIGAAAEVAIPPLMRALRGRGAEDAALAARIDQELGVPTATQRAAEQVRRPPEVRELAPSRGPTARDAHLEPQLRAVATPSLLNVKPEPHPVTGDISGYRGVHLAPTREYGSPLHAMDEMYPADIYGPDAARLYGMDAEMMQQIQSFKGRPDAMVKVYRAVPQDAPDKINPGDWVTPSREYAELHARVDDDPLNDFKIVEMEVRAAELFTEGNSPYEFGYDPLPMMLEGALSKGVDTARRLGDEAAAIDASLARNAFNELSDTAALRLLYALDGNGSWDELNPTDVRRALAWHESEDPAWFADFMSRPTTRIVAPELGTGAPPPSVAEGTPLVAELGGTEPGYDIGERVGSLLLTGNTRPGEGPWRITHLEEISDFEREMVLETSGSDPGPGLFPQQHWQYQTYDEAARALAGSTDDVKPLSASSGLLARADELPMDEASRMARARAQGFDVDTPQYTGWYPQEIPGIQNRRVGDPHQDLIGTEGLTGDTWFSDLPEIAEEYTAGGPGGQMAKAFVRGNLADLTNPSPELLEELQKRLTGRIPLLDELYNVPSRAGPGDEISALETHLTGGRLWSADAYGGAPRGFEEDVLNELRDMGFDGVKIPDSTFGRPNVSTVIFDPNVNARMPGAAFDPANLGKPGIWGAADPQVINAMARMGAGATAGAVGDEENRLRGAVIGAGVGLGAPTAARRLRGMGEAGAVPTPWSGAVKRGLANMANSRVVRAITGAPQANASGAQWQGILRKTPAGVPKTEMEWTGIKDYLADNPDEMFTRDQLLAFMDEHGIELKETWRGGAGSDVVSTDMPSPLEWRRTGPGGGPITADDLIRGNVEEWATTPSGYDVWVRETKAAGEDRWESGYEAMVGGYGATRDEAIESLRVTMEEDFFETQSFAGEPAGVMFPGGSTRIEGTSTNYRELAVQLAKYNPPNPYRWVDRIDWSSRRRDLEWRSTGPGGRPLHTGHPQLENWVSEEWARTPDRGEGASAGDVWVIDTGIAGPGRWEGGFKSADAGPIGVYGSTREEAIEALHRNVEDLFEVPQSLTATTLDPQLQGGVGIIESATLPHNGIQVWRLDTGQPGNDRWRGGFGADHRRWRDVRQDTAVGSEYTNQLGEEGPWYRVEGADPYTGSWAQNTGEWDITPYPTEEAARAALSDVPDKRWDSIRVTGADEDALARELHRELEAIGQTPPMTKGFAEGHFPEENILFHIRMSDRIYRNPDTGKMERVLFAEEIQSDWHQLGREEGYLGEGADVWRTRVSDEIKTLEERGFDVVESPDRDQLGFHETAEGGGDILQVSQMMEFDGDDTWELAQKVQREWDGRSGRVGVPDAPFKATSEWTEMAVRRLIQEGIDGGYDRVAWASGRQQADLNDLRRQVSKIEYHKESGSLKAWDLDGDQVASHTGITPKQLPKYIGKEPARRLLAAKPPSDGWRVRDTHTGQWDDYPDEASAMTAYNALDSAMKQRTDVSRVGYDIMETRHHTTGEPRFGVYGRDGDNLTSRGTRAEAEAYIKQHLTQTRSIEGSDLEIGGQGMIGYYDEIFPITARKYGKQVGGIETDKIDLGAPAPWTSTSTETPPSTYQTQITEAIGYNGIAGAEEQMTQDYAALTRLFDDNVTVGQLDVMGQLNTAMYEAVTRGIQQSKLRDAELALGRSLADRDLSEPWSEELLHIYDLSDEDVLILMSSQPEGLGKYVKSEALEARDRWKNTIDYFIGLEQQGVKLADAEDAGTEMQGSFKITPAMRDIVQREGQRLGAADPQAVGAMARMAAGATVGAAGDEENRLRGAMIGAGVGLGAPTAARRLRGMGEAGAVATPWSKSPIPGSGLYRGLVIPSSKSAARPSHRIISGRMDRAEEALSYLEATKPPPWTRATRGVFDVSNFDPDYRRLAGTGTMPAASGKARPGLTQSLTHERVMNILDRQARLGLEQGGRGFYNLDPIAQFVDGMNAPRNSFEDWVAASSAGSIQASIPLEMANAAIMLYAKANDMPYLRAIAEFKARYPGGGNLWLPKVESGVQFKVFDKYRLTGTVDPVSPASGSRKVPSYDRSKLGETGGELLGPSAVIDTHEMKSTLGMTGQERLINRLTGAEYDQISRGVYGGGAERLEILEDQYQAGRWIGGGPMTGMKSAGGDYVQHLEDILLYTALATNKDSSPAGLRKLFEDVINGRDFLIPFWGSGSPVTRQGTLSSGKDGFALLPTVAGIAAVGAGATAVGAAVTNKLRGMADNPPEHRSPAPPR